MTWEEVIADPDLQPLRYKIETNELGQIVMSPPPSSYHQEFGGEIVYRLRVLRPDGRAFQECPVQTPLGTKVPDVVWISFGRRQQTARQPAFTIAPEICVEVVSPSNTAEELRRKGELYFQAGALEFWLCDELGNLSFYTSAGEAEHSALCPEFPARISIDINAPPPAVASAYPRPRPPRGDAPRPSGGCRRAG